MSFETDLASRIAAIDVHAPEPRIDLDAAIRTGKKRRWRQRVTVTGAFACVALAVAGSVFLRAPSPKSYTAPDFGSAYQPATTAGQLAGRWLATSIGGTDAASLPERNGLPANIVIGADGTPGEWVVNAFCFPREGTFALHPDGSFVVTSFARLPIVFCPNETSVDPQPDLTVLLKRTAFVAVDSGNPRTMRFLDRQRKVIAVWREDVALKSPASICKKALGSAATTDGTFTTVQTIVDDEIAAPAIDGTPATTIKADQVLSNAAGDDVAVYCVVDSARYAVTTGGQKALLKPAK